MRVALPTRTPSARPRPGLALAVAVGSSAVLLCWTGLRSLQADSFRLLYAGRWIAAHGLPNHEMFTLAAGTRGFVDQQWLAELGGYEVWRVAGYAGLVLVCCLTLALSYGLLAALLRRRGASPALAGACTALAILGALSLTFVRAQVLALPLFVIMLWLCLADGDRGRLSWQTGLILPLLALWANIHGSVLIAAAIAAAYLAYRAAALVGEHRRDAVAYAVMALAAAAMPLATPYGLHVLTYYREMVGNSAVARADIEWDPPAFPQLSFFQFALPLVAAVASTLLARRRGHRPPPPLIIALLISTVAGAMAMRNNVWLDMAAAALLGETARVWIPTADTSLIFRRGLALVGSALALIATGLVVSRGDGGYEAAVPAHAVAATVAYLSAHPCARVLADNMSASALLWLDPAAADRVAFDGELEVYPPQALSQWVSFQAADQRGWLQAARGYQVLMGTRSDHEDLVARLYRLRNAVRLGADAHGIAVALPAPSYGVDCGMRHV